MIISIQDDFKMSVEKAGKMASFYTYPIFQLNINDRPELIASCVAVEIDDRYFLSTAKHTLNSLDDS